MAGYCITPFWHNCNKESGTHPDSSVVVTPGIPDTTYDEGQSTQGVVSGQFHIHENDSIRNVETLHDSDFIYEPFETKLDTTLKQGTQVNLRHTTWIKGSIKNIASSLEWNIKERPCPEVSQTDTAYVTYTTPTSFWDNRFIPYLGAGVIYNPATKAVDWGIQLGLGIRLN